MGGIGQKKATAGQPAQFSIVMKKQFKSRKPRSQRAECMVGLSSKAAVVKSVNAQTRYRLYRGDLSRMAQKRIFKLREIRCKYKKWLKKEAKLNAGAGDDDDEADNPTKNEDLVEVD